MKRNTKNLLATTAINNLSTDNHEIKNQQIKGVYTQEAPFYAARGIPVIPCKNKKPLIKCTKIYKIPMHWIDTYENLYPTADIMLITGRRSGITVADIDDPDLLHAAREMFPNTLAVAKTPRGFHLYNRYAGEGCCQHFQGLRIDIRGDGGFIVMPPTEGYTWIEGGPESLVQ